MRFMSRCTSAFCLSFLLTVGCRDVRDLVALGTALNHQYPDSHVSVSLTDGLILTLTVADSSSAAGSCESQAATAMQMASFVRGNYGGFASLQTISIAFAPGPSGTRGTAGAAGLPFRFARTQVGAGLTSADSTGAVRSCKAWRDLQ
jgi:hypothetical protein